MEATGLGNHKSESGNKYTNPKENGRRKDFNHIQKTAVPRNGQTECTTTENDVGTERTFLEELKMRINNMLNRKEHKDHQKDMIYLYIDINAVIMVLIMGSQLHNDIQKEFQSEIDAKKLKLNPNSCITQLSRSRPFLQTGSLIGVEKSGRYGTIGLVLKDGESRSLLTAMHIFTPQENGYQMLHGEFYTNLNDKNVSISSTCEGYYGDYTFPIAEDPNAVRAEIVQKADIAVLPVKNDCHQYTKGLQELPEGNNPFTMSDVSSHVTFTSPPSPHLKVTKDGATTGATFGWLIDRTYQNYFVKNYRDANSNEILFADQGDSGSCVFATQNDGVSRGSVIYGLLVEKIEISPTDHTYVVQHVASTMRALAGRASSRLGVLNIDHAKICWTP